MKKNYKPNGIHASMHPCIHALIHAHHIIPTHLFFPSSYLPSFPASFFTRWPPEAGKLPSRLESFGVYVTIGSSFLFHVVMLVVILCFPEGSGFGQLSGHIVTFGF
jgi:hypothetical protein